MSTPSSVREFESGATRDSDEGKLDYEGFLSPRVLRRFALYMHKNRVQSDGSLRDSDNWQRGMPLEAYMKSLWRHFMDVWELYRHVVVGGICTSKDLEELEEALCAVLFNTQGFLHEWLGE